MSRIDMDSLVDIIFNLRWKSDTAHHTDCYQASRVNIWRDYFPKGLLDAFMGKESGERVEIRGFGSFKVKFYNGYKGRNPKTGDIIVQPRTNQQVFADNVGDTPFSSLKVSRKY